ncbi:TetR/AcrR family transcriptional regulator [Alkaliphilus peptidifermentans]|uniref:Transcriptional regulator, TetR family n=1 Tax=Alkaliphilus peptidifermentans DSM 18978 TaxID=1120976 RepID=A0A1G5ETE1_9FIRM|nr:TetR/AcrR family transcriptional regulator [Alkaliphilus peptidifermentans]SCY29940.1 transcriptional regulator, TetR family [Alkaliphilus peptidifermentans DSM 18978]
MKSLTNRQRQAINTKFKISEAAVQLFREKGYEQIKVTDICRAAGISVGAFYHHFDSKDSIFTTAYKQIEILIEDVISIRQYPTPICKLLDIIDLAAEIVEDLGSNYISQVYKQNLVTKSEYTLSKKRFTYVAIHKVIVQALENGILKCDLSADEITHMIIRIERGIIYDWCLFDGQYDLRLHSRKELCIFLKGMGLSNWSYNNQCKP